MSLPDLSPLDDLHEDRNGCFWRRDRRGDPFYDKSPIVAIAAVYQARAIELPISFKKYWCEYCNTSGEQYFILNHQQVHCEGKEKRRCPDCHITLPYHHKTHANFCAASPSSPTLAGRIWSSDTLCFHYAVAKIYTLLVVKAEQHVRAAVDSVRRPVLVEALVRLKQSIPLGLVPSYKPQIDMFQRELAKLSTAHGSSASLEKLPIPLNSRQRFVYGRTHAVL